MNQTCNCKSTLPVSAVCKAGVKLCSQLFLALSLGRYVGNAGSISGFFGIVYEYMYLCKNEKRIKI